MTEKDYRTKSPILIFLSYFKKHKRLFLCDLLCACLIAGVERGGETLHAPDPHEPFVEGDVVWIVGESADVYKLVGRKCEGFDMG